MNSRMKGQIADTIVKLHSIIPEINDFHEFTSILDSTINELFHVDWLQLGLIGNNTAVNLFTSESFSTGWEEKFIENYNIDTVRIETFNNEIGGTYLFERGRHPDKENEEYLLESVKKYTDASHFLTVHTAKNTEFDSAIGFYRTDKSNYFTRDEEKIVSYLSPLLVSVTHTMMLYYDFELKRVSHELLSRSLKALTITFNHALLPIDIPNETKTFLSRYFSDTKEKTIPHIIENWLKTEVAPKGYLEPGLGPWILDLHLPGLELHLKAHSISTGINQQVLVLMLYPHNQPEDFSILYQDGFTQREVETLSFLPLGYTNKQIAIAMDIEEVTVKKHLKSCAQRLGTIGKTDTLYQALQRKRLLELITQ